MEGTEHAIEKITATNISVHIQFPIASKEKTVYVMNIWRLSLIELSRSGMQHSRVAERFPLDCSSLFLLFHKYNINLFF